jgi:hypothetical protein
MRATARFAATTSAPCVATVARTLEYSFGFFCKLAQLFVELGTNPTPSSNAAVLARQYDAPTFTAMFTAGRLNKCCGECGGEDDNCENARHAVSVAARVELLRVFHTDATSKLDECNGDVAAATAASELYARLNKLICVYGRAQMTTVAPKKRCGSEIFSGGAVRFKNIFLGPVSNNWTSPTEGHNVRIIGRAKLVVGSV